MCGSSISMYMIPDRFFPDRAVVIAARNLRWPLLASDEAGWEKQAVMRINGLDLGSDLQFIKVRFRRARGTDENLPARLWAKAAVRTIEETRRRLLMFSGLVRDFGFGGAFADFAIETGWEFGPHPKWIDAMRTLSPFSRESLPQWKNIIRWMIREQLPDFHTQSEWVNQRRTAAANGRDLIGEIRNAILDDIVSALTSLAPEKPC